MDRTLDFTAEIDRLDQDIRSATAGIDRFLTMAGLLGAAAVTLGLSRKESQPLILILVPYAMAIVMAFILQIYTDNERKYVLRQWLEERHEKETGDLMLQPVVISAAYRGRTSVIFTSIIWVVLLGALFTASIWSGFHELSPWWLGFHIVGLLLAVIAIACAAIELLGASDTTLAIVNDHLTRLQQADVEVKHGSTD